MRICVTSQRPVCNVHHSTLLSFRCIRDALAQPGASSVSNRRRCAAALVSWTEVYKDYIGTNPDNLGRRLIWDWGVSGEGGSAVVWASMPAELSEVVSDSHTRGLRSIPCSCASVLLCYCATVLLCYCALAWVVASS
jgi:hypothetical protein